MMVTVPLHSYTCYFSFFKKVIAAILRVKWYLTVVLICVYLMNNDFGYIFVCFSFVYLLWIDISVLCLFLLGVCIFWDV